MNTLLQAVAANQRFLGKTNPIMTAAVADGGSIQDREYIQRAARGIADAGLWGNLKLWIDPGLAKLRNSGGTDYIPKIYDFSDNANNGVQTTEGSQPYLTSGKLTFDGSADFLSCGNGASLNFGTGTFTVQLWLYKNLSSSSTLYRALSKGANSDVTSQAGFAIVMNDETCGFLVNPTGTRVSTYTGNVLSTTTWYLITGVCERGSLQRIFYNTTAGNTATAPVGDVSNATLDLHIGKNSSSSAGYWPGRLADIRIYNTALTGDQITAIYNQTSYRYA